MASEMTTAEMVARFRTAAADGRLEKLPELAEVLTIAAARLEALDKDNTAATARAEKAEAEAAKWRWLYDVCKAEVDFARFAWSNDLLSWHAETQTIVAPNLPREWEMAERAHDAARKEAGL